MHTDTDLIHQKNVWILKMFACFFAIALVIDFISNGSVMGMKPFIGLVLLLVLAGFVKSHRWPFITMLLTIGFVFAYLLILIFNDPSVVNYIFLGLIPLLSFFYQSYSAVILSGMLYVLSGIYFMFMFDKTVFSGIVSSRDTAYILLYDLFILLFSLFCTYINRSLSARAERSENRLQTILKSVSVGIWTYDFHTRQFEVSDGFERITGYTQDMLQHCTNRKGLLIHPDDQERFENYRQEMILGRTSSAKECRLLYPDGHVKWIQCRGTPYFDHNGNLDRLEGIIIEVTERKQLEETIQFLAYHDELTGLPNRRQLNEKFAKCAENKTDPLALMFLDLDNFKEVNDTFGHEAGDSLLKYISGKLTSLIGREGMVCRLGGDEFVILLVGLDKESVLKVVERIKESFSEGYDYLGTWINVSASIGICISPEGQGNLDDMIREADASMYEVKRGANRSYRVYGEPNPVS